jgi:hypothetical protein
MELSNWRQDFLLSTTNGGDLYPALLICGMHGQDRGTIYVG